jgi:hypothetical protein
MPGTRPKTFRGGDQAEKEATVRLKAIAQVVEVPREEDFGIDLICGLLENVRSSVRVCAHFVTQVKSIGTKHWVLSGQEQVNWILGRADHPVHPAPFFITRADVERSTIEIYQLQDLWMYRWVPFLRSVRIRFPDHPDFPQGDDFKLCGGRAGGTADFPDLLIALGPPIARLWAGMTQAEEDSASRAILGWIRSESLNLAIAALGLPISYRIMRWKPNDLVDPDAGPIVHAEGGDVFSWQLSHLLALAGGRVLPEELHEGIGPWISSQSSFGPPATAAGVRLLSFPEWKPEYDPEGVPPDQNPNWTRVL